jgi:hypothetical protein
VPACEWSVRGGVWVFGSTSVAKETGKTRGDGGKRVGLVGGVRCGILCSAQVGHFLASRRRQTVLPVGFKDLFFEKSNL